MPTLEACKEMIAELSEAKKWSKDPNIKFLYAFVELGEAVDAWKKRKPPSKVIEEIIDAIYYLIHCAWCINPHINLDQLFINKHRINYKRSRKYPNDTTEGDDR